MPRHQEPMKDVGDRDSPRGGAVNRAVIRGCPNGGETRHPSWGVSLMPEFIGYEGGTWGGSETSQYPQEEKTIVIP